MHLRQSMHKFYFWTVKRVEKILAVSSLAFWPWDMLNNFAWQKSTWNMHRNFYLFFIVNLRQCLTRNQLALDCVLHSSECIVKLKTILRCLHGSSAKKRTKKRCHISFHSTTKSAFYNFDIMIYIQSTMGAFRCCGLGACACFFCCSYARSCCSIIEWTNLKRLRLNFNPNSRVFLSLTWTVIVSIVNYKCHIHVEKRC